MPQCLAYGCQTRRGRMPEGMSFHRFPRDAQLCTKWVRRCGTDVGDIIKFVKAEIISNPPKHYLCSRHFTEDMFELDFRYELMPDSMKPRRPRRILKANALPTMFDFAQKHIRNSSVQRIDRNMRRKLLEDLLSEPQPIQEHLDDTAGSSNMQQPASVLEHDRCEGMQMDVTEQNRSVYMESGIHPTYVEMELGTVCSEVVVDNSEVMISGLRKTGKLKNKSCQTQNMLAAVSIGIQANMQESSSNKSEAKLIQSHNVAVQFPEIVVPTFVDHNYSKVSKCIQKRNALKQSTEEDVCHTNVESGSNHHSVVQSCTEVVQVQEENEGSMCSDNSSEDCMSEVSTSNMGNENLEDPDWGESSISMSQSEADDSFQELSVEEDIVGQKKFIVFEACLDNLLMKLICPVCRAAACEIEKKTILGTFVCVKVSCFNGHEILSWESQPLLGRMPAGNLMSAAAVLFSGTTYAHISRFCAYIGVEFIGKTTYYDIQSQYLFPVVQFHWHEQQKELLKDAEGRMIRLGGDGRCDSPGFSAKYCTYTMMDLDTGYILDFAVEQVSEGVASVGLEKIGFERCMRNLISKGMSIGVVATDRHRGIALLMRTQFTDIDHQFDIWHMCKSIRKK
ncbi:uncharacterized protein LOC122801130 [Protopterus annectens]|uniref:uncharacterized protein LOC122801130 n=1 Tax=Protopterus annectens TaxID=7888 RepID=UPI001CFAF08B|nr:uncharacterized protein LOC122801130 [Protopterus annectens]